MIVALTHASYIVTAWVVSAVAVALYAARLVQRGRRLTGAVPPERRRWLTTEAGDTPPRR